MFDFANFALTIVALFVSYYYFKKPVFSLNCKYENVWGQNKNISHCDDKKGSHTAATHMHIAVANIIFHFLFIGTQWGT